VNCTLQAFVQLNELHVYKGIHLLPSYCWVAVLDDNRTKRTSFGGGQNQHLGAGCEAKGIRPSGKGRNGVAITGKGGQERGSEENRLFRVRNTYGGEIWFLC